MDKNLKTIKQKNQFAVITIYTDSKVKEYKKPSKSGEKENEEIDAAESFKLLGKLTGSKKIEETAESIEKKFSHITKPVLDQGLSSLEKNINSVSEIKILPFSAMTKNKAYTSSFKKEGKDGNWFEVMNTAFPEGFGNIEYTNSKITEKLCSDLGVEGFIVIEVKFLTQKTEGIILGGEAQQARVSLKCGIYDKKAKILWEKTEVAVSSKDVSATSGIYNRDDMNKLLLDCYDKAGKNIFKNLSKDLSSAK
ncbi:MAG TPA: hypothetical protein PLE16_08600 [Spirochaetota bacterium]|nr:hypothetical protein [Spirochaetota bacterium]HPM34642.1 hypothetical protein [Spirochaetota bacterium]HPW50759.1 hypothetical protein [Spirochaetota bacterium]